MSEEGLVITNKLSKLGFFAFWSVIMNIGFIVILVRVLNWDIPLTSPDVKTWLFILINILVPVYIAFIWIMIYKYTETIKEVKLCEIDIKWYEQNLLETRNKWIKNKTKKVFNTIKNIAK